MLKRRDDVIVYERVGSTSQPVTDKNRLEQMRRERRGRHTLDQFAVRGATLDDLELEHAQAKFAEEGTKLDEAALKTFGIATEVNGQLTPTQAGILLFGKEPNSFLPDARFRVIRYAGTSKAGEVIDQDDYRDVSLLRAIDKVVHFIQRNTGTAQVMVGRRHRNISHYSETVLREVLHNAVAHADYSEVGRHLNASVYSDRIEIDSPGKMPVGMTVQQLIEGVSQIRNRAIVRIMNELGYVEERGTVYAKALAAAKDGYPLPEWDQPGQLVRVTVRPHEAAAVAAGEPEGEAPARRRGNRTRDVLDALHRGREATADELAGEVGLKKRRVQDYLRRMQEDNLVEATKEPRHPQQTYRLTERGRQVRNAGAQ